jgi:NAD(P)-dependent dehydrogenase (short-subunit alcohol dehydrogenase family)
MTPRPLEGKVALITGASRGLGKAMAIALAQGGARLALVARDKDKLQETAAAVQAEYGKISILINNAGINLRKNVHEFTLAEWNSVMDTNVTSVFLMCRSFVPMMKGAGYGRIINMTSIMSHVSLPGRTAYSTTKTALLGFTRALALELAPDAITVVGISPGPFATEMNTPLMNNPEINAVFMSKIALGRWGKVEEIGKLALFLCSEDAGFITGTDIVIDGGWCAQ